MAPTFGHKEFSRPMHLAHCDCESLGFNCFSKSMLLGAADARRQLHRRWAFLFRTARGASPATDAPPQALMEDGSPQASRS